jgi:hypothetical protein
MLPVFESNVVSNRKEKTDITESKYGNTYRVFPVGEAIGMMVWIAANHRDKSVHH